MRGRLYKAEKMDSIRDLIKRSVKLFGDGVAFREIDRQKQVIEYTYRKLENDVRALGTKLIDMGMKGYHIAVIGENAYQWVVSYLAVINGVGVVVPLDKDLTDDDIKKLLLMSDSDAIICSGTFTEAVMKALPECPGLKACIVMNGQNPPEGFRCLTGLIEDGYALLEAGDSRYTECEIDTGALGEIVFTSGTTGANKGVMLSHKNLMAVVYGVMCLMKVEGVSISVLPISHTYECTCHILGGMYSGLTICFNDSLKRVADNMRLFQPDIGVMVPLFLETMLRNIWTHAKKEGLDKHLKYGIALSNLLRVIGLDFRRLYFGPVLNNFGGNLKLIICGGAPLGKETMKGIEDLGIDIINGYGISECGPLVSSNSMLWRKKGSVGRVMPGCTVKIMNPDKKGVGEILVRGDNVMLGYYKDEENTRRSFTDDGWFMTGDLGYLDRNNFLYICGRKKNLIILSNGKNVHPEELEQAIVEKLAYVKEVIVYASVASNGTQDAITACIYLDDEFIQSSEITDIRERLDEDIKQLNRALPSFKRIAKTIIRDTEFDKTTTRKIKRTRLDEQSGRRAESV